MRSSRAGALKRTLAGETGGTTVSTASAVRLTSAGPGALALGGAAVLGGITRGGVAELLQAVTAKTRALVRCTPESYPGRRLSSISTGKPRGSVSWNVPARQAGNDLLRECFR
jgi:hypothetical protein